mmetsp:Transcript_10644/g.25710  ORF Transcript_10644/g.25710 Transcript_10644/m.25710 type:complete len:85 (+) Transcript_10644:558-812(+)
MLINGVCTKHSHREHNQRTAHISNNCACTNSCGGHELARLHLELQQHSRVRLIVFHCSSKSQCLDIPSGAPFFLIEKPILPLTW